MKKVWALRTVLEEEEKTELEALRRKSNGRDSERALIILLNASGDTAPEIAVRLCRSEHTIRTAIRRYHQSGLEGLKRSSPPGRPAVFYTQIIPILHKLLKRSPQAFAYSHKFWTRILISKHLKRKNGIDVSPATVARALHKAGYIWKRPCYTKPAKGQNASWIIKP